MRKYLIHLLLFLLVFNFSLAAQEEEKEEEKTKTFFGGINVGAFFANGNAAIIYSGGNAITPYGIDFILRQPLNKITFDNYFKHPYSVADLPQNPVYRTAVDIGFHGGFHINKVSAIYLDINITQLKYEQTFSIAVDNPLRQSPEPTYEQIPIFGEEKRFNLNLGSQLSYYTSQKIDLYWSIFGNLNVVNMERNYFVVNDVEYEIYHNPPDQTDRKPGGLGFGGGTGLGLKYQFTENIILDFTYNFYYTKINFTEAIQPYGMHHGLLMRILWN
jgi:opacity protein-like surface antigen